MKKSKKILLLAAVATVLVGIVLAGFVAQYYLDNRRPNFQKEYVLYVYPDMTAEQVLDSILVGAQVERPRSVEHVFKKMNVAENMKPGRYVIETSKPSIYVARMLVYGWQTPQNLTLSGTIRSKERLVKKISNQMMVSADEVAAALEDSTFLAQYGFTPENVFAMIMQDTYQMYWTASVKDIFDRFKKEYDAFWTPVRIAKAKKQGLSKMDVSIVASIVSGETLKEFEYPIIAGVYLNRYRTGMKLQADPTVAFCFDYKLNRILHRHMEVDSPYNTYKYAGLPPAPINVPPKACLEAVLNPDQHGYIYFCASPDFNGTHRFAVTYAEHMNNANEFHKALNAREKAKKAASK
jgi:UPF0755 protein